MPYYARKHQLTGVLLYHVFNRSNGRLPIFHDDRDFKYFKSVLSRYKKRFNVKMYHWVIMSNHYHFLIEIEEPELISKFMAGVGKAYTYYYHLENKTCGYLWQGRFKMQPIEKAHYLFSCGRYIERNPVDARMVIEAKQYNNSSARYYCLGEFDGLTDESPLYEQFGRNEFEQKMSYEGFLKTFDEGEHRLYDQMEKPMGYQVFIDRLVKEKGRYMPRRRGRHRGKN